MSHVTIDQLRDLQSRVNELNRMNAVLKNLYPPLALQGYNVFDIDGSSRYLSREELRMERECLRRWSIGFWKESDYLRGQRDGIIVIAFTEDDVFWPKERRTVRIYPIGRTASRLFIEQIPGQIVGTPQAQCVVHLGEQYRPSFATNAVDLFRFLRTS